MFYTLVDKYSTKVQPCEDSRIKDGLLASTAPNSTPHSTVLGSLFRLGAFERRWAHLFTHCRICQ